jgi:hypothetical protein
MATSKKHKQLLDGYRFVGFTAVKVKGVFGDPKALVIAFTRRSKKRSAVRAGASSRVGTTRRVDECGICPAVIGGCIWSLIFGAWSVGAVAP